VITAATTCPPCVRRSRSGGAKRPLCCYGRGHGRRYATLVVIVVVVIQVVRLLILIFISIYLFAVHIIPRVALALAAPGLYCPQFPLLELLRFYVQLYTEKMI
jgi:hypothetical protein